jgi:hypothetical protein
MPFKPQTVGWEFARDISGIAPELGVTKRVHLTRRVMALSLLVLFAMVAGPSALAQTPKITSVSKVSALQYQTITIKGTGFGTQPPYSGPSCCLEFIDVTGDWAAGDNGQNLVVNSWTNLEIVVGGFVSACYYEPQVGDEIYFSVRNAQTQDVWVNSKETKVVALVTTNELTSSPNPSTEGELVTFTATVTSTGGTPPYACDGDEAVSFMAGETRLGIGYLSGGQATFSTTTLKVGTTPVTAVYGGDTAYKASKSKPVKQVVQQ